MISLAVGLMLVLSLLLVNIWIRGQPLSASNPLDVDETLPLPWAGYASTIFSLTALFGSYFAILVILGPVAMAGLAIGSIVGLILIKGAVDKSPSASFHEFLLSRRFSLNADNNSFFLGMLMVMQLGFAISELVIMRDLSVAAFSMAPRHATIFAVAVALVSYLYCLLGGYGALYRTDIVQYAFMLVMCAIIGLVFLVGAMGLSHWAITQPLDQHFWTFGLPVSPVGAAAANFCVGLLTGICFLVSNPDTWKRVFLVTRFSNSSKHPLGSMAVAGALPFVLLLPAAFLVPYRNLSEIGPFDLFIHVGQNRFVLLAVVLGMTASFMSSFDSSLLSAVHLQLARREQAPLNQPVDLAAFRYQIGICFAAVTAGSLAIMSGLGNAYFIAACLLSFYAMLGGIVIGTRFLTQPLRTVGFPWLATAVLVGWFAYISSIENSLERPTPYLVKAFPVGMILFVLFIILGKIRSS